MEGQFYWALGGLNISPSSEELSQMGLEFPTFFFLGGGGGGGGLLKFVCFQVKFNFSIENIFFKVVKNILIYKVNCNLKVPEWK